ncbi:DUF3658 domain-containing protein [Citrobacter braakii]|uniref:DUF3658 domain-containing protein n=1 Tax=Citrobacter braakii TaxID=57706 RepID=UPI0011ECEB11|nr:DUF3658 domain-containing protein [Citrobacter braakii]
MKTHIRHVCQAGSALIRLESLFDADIRDIGDDCSIGPLTDVDTASPLQRIAFWHDFFTLSYGDAGRDWTASFQGVHQRLYSLGEGADEIVIWSGTHPAEQLLRRRIYWWLQDKTIKVTEVLVDSDDLENPEGRHYAAVAQISTERLKLRFAERQIATPALRRQLADEWVELRDHGVGIRLIKNNRLTEHPIGYFDTRLLSIVGKQPTRLAHAIGQAMSETGMTDTFCKWRYITLVQRGELVLISGNLHDGSDAAIIGKPRGK